MNANLAAFARMAAPRGSRPPQGYSAPSTSVRPPVNPASKGRGGDSMMAHMTPGEIAVPPQIQTPEVLAALNKGFAAAGANPTSFQAGNPDQKINPETGMPEFGFFDMLLPTALGLAGSAFLGPELLAPALVDAGVGASTASTLGGILGGGIGSTIGNVATGKDPLTSIAGGFGGAIGGSLLGSAFGSGPAAAAQVGPNAGVPDLSNVGANYLSATTNAPLQVALNSAPAGGLDGILQKLMPNGIKGALGSFVGGQLGSMLGEGLVPGKQANPPASNNSAGSAYVPPPIAGGAGSRMAAPMFPGRQYRPGMDPTFNYFPT